MPACRTPRSRATRTAIPTFAPTDGQGNAAPDIIKQVGATITAIEEDDRRLTVDAGKDLRLRVASDTNIEGIPDRTRFRNGMTISAEYQVPVGGNAALGYDIMEVRVEK